MSQFQDRSLLRFNHPICHQTKKLRHEPFYNLALVDKLQKDRQVSPFAPRRAFGVEAMVIAEACLRTEDSGSSNSLLVKKSENIVMEKFMAGADIRVQMNDDPQRRPDSKHPHSLQEE